MTTWRGVCALLAVSSVVACATATTDGAFDVPEGNAGASPMTSVGGALGSSGTPAGGAAHAGSNSGSAGASGGRPAGGSPGVAGAAGASNGGHSGTSSGSGGASAGGQGEAGAAGESGTGGPCANPKDVSGGKTNNFGTTGAVCFRTTETFNTIGCSNWGGRTIKVNGVLATCNVKGTFAPMIDGYNYFDVSAGDVDFAAFVWYTS